MRLHQFSFGMRQTKCFAFRGLHFNSFVCNVALKYLARRPKGIPFEIFKGVNEKRCNSVNILCKKVQNIL